MSFFSLRRRKVESTATDAFAEELRLLANACERSRGNDEQELVRQTVACLRPYYEHLFPNLWRSCFERVTHHCAHSAFESAMLCLVPRGMPWALMRRHDQKVFCQVSMTEGLVSRTETPANTAALALASALLRGIAQMLD